MKLSDTVSALQSGSQLPLWDNGEKRFNKLFYRIPANTQIRIRFLGPFIKGYRLYNVIPSLLPSDAQISPDLIRRIMNKEEEAFSTAKNILDRMIVTGKR